MEKTFAGKFKETLEHFIKHKRDLGYKYAAIRDNLRRFSEYTLKHESENGCLNKDLFKMDAEEEK